MSTTDEQRKQRFTDLFEQHHTKVLAYARRRIDTDAASDVVADTFLAAWRNLDQLSGDPLLWLYGLARGTVANHRRRLGRTIRLHEHLNLLDPAIPAPDHAASVGWQDPFDVAFGLLSGSEREVLRLVAWEGLGASEGAAVLGCSVTAFKVRLHRARRRLRHFLDADEESWADRSGERSEQAPVRRVLPWNPSIALLQLSEHTVPTQKEPS